MFAHNPYPQKILKGMEDILSEDGILIIENAYAIETFQKGNLIKFITNICSITQL